jgi:hypothetical protein
MPRKVVRYDPASSIINVSYDDAGRERTFKASSGTLDVHSP